MSVNEKFSQTMRIAIPLDRMEPAASGTTAVPRVAAAKPQRIRDLLSDAEYAMYAQLVQNIYDAMLLTTPDGAIVDGNSRAEEFLLYEIAQLSAMRVSQIICGLDDGVVRTISENLNNERFTMVEAYCERRNKTVFPAEIVASKLAFGGRPHLCFFIRDITKRKESEEDLDRARARLAQAERLETAGTIAGHIAHDFNNLLTPLLAYPDLIKEDLPPDSQGQQDLMLMKKSAQQIADINQQLLALSRRGYYEQVVLNVNAIIEEVVAMLNRASPVEGVETRLELAEDLLNIKGGSEQLVRVFGNLCQNAIEAMNRQGRLTIRTANVLVESPVGEREIIPPGEYVRIEIEDTGHGVPAAIRDKIFDPFFTTKKADRQRGSGLGLSVVHGIVKDHKGYIDLHSKINQGTTFSLYFPVCRDEIQEAEPQADISGTETVMVVDDDPLQTDVSSRVLKKLGYRVISAQSGEEALEMMRSRQASQNFPAIVVLDMMMGPGIDGADTFREMKAINPKQKAIILSGYVESDRVTLAQSLGAGAYIRKPVTIEKLGKALRNELAR
jgi:PAS domain S-box-containing protein